MAKRRRELIDPSEQPDFDIFCRICDIARRDCDRPHVGHRLCQLQELAYLDTITIFAQLFYGLEYEMYGYHVILDLLDEQEAQEFSRYAKYIAGHRICWTLPSSIQLQSVNR